MMEWKQGAICSVPDGQDLNHPAYYSNQRLPTQNQTLRETLMKANSKGGQAATYYARGTFNGSMFWGLLIGRSEIKNTTKLDANSSDSLLYVHLRHYGHDGITR